MTQFEKYTPYYYNGTTWEKVTSYIKKDSSFINYVPYIYIELPILDAFILPTTIENLSFEKR